jgi:hypothetical protein
VILATFRGEVRGDPIERQTLSAACYAAGAGAEDGNVAPTEKPEGDE